MYNYMKERKYFQRNVAIASRENIKAPAMQELNYLNHIYIKVVMT
jgi:hypothetical protein